MVIKKKNNSKKRNLKKIYNNILIKIDYMIMKMKNKKRNKINHRGSNKIKAVGVN